MRFQASSLSVATLLSIASSHSIFTNLQVGSTVNPVGAGIRIPSYDGPITDVTSSNIACNGGPNPTTPSSQVFDVAAGSTVKAIWRHTQTSGSNDVIDPSHHGPVMAYLKKVGNAASDTGVGGGWFKISEAGLVNSAAQHWATDDLISALGQQSITIPSCIPAGQYLLRAELIALHGASSANGAQFYMECAQINVTGGGSKSPATVSFPGAYSAKDPGILINIYATLSSYTIPGPPVFTC